MNLYNGKYYECNEASRVSGKINELLDAMQIKLNCTNDAQLARVLGFARPEISKLRHRVVPLSAAKLARIAEATGWSIYTIREILGA
jgi:antitoxin HigA-1